MKIAPPGQLLALMFGLFVLVFVLQTRILSVLRRRHPEVHRLIPTPFLVADGERENNLPAVRFFWRFVLHSEYFALGDAELTFLCRSVLAFATLFVVAFLATLFSFVGGSLS